MITRFFTRSSFVASHAMFVASHAAQRSGGIRGGTPLRYEPDYKPFLSLFLTRWAFLYKLLLIKYKPFHRGVKDPVRAIKI